MMSIYPTAVGHWLATAHCLFFWPFFRSFFFCLFSEIPGFCIGTRHRGDWGGRRYCFLFLFVLFFFNSVFLFSLNCTIWARLSVGTLGFIKLDTILYRSYFDIKDAIMGVGLQIALWKYLEFDKTKCKNWILFILF
jgi:hypothetical protein